MIESPPINRSISRRVNLECVEMSTGLEYGGSMVGMSSSALPPMATDRLVERITRCVIGLALFGIGISLIIDARIGLPPWDVFHQGVAERIDRSIGTVIIGTGAVLMLL